jgi:histidine ammonia-lyase
MADVVAAMSVEGLVATNEAFDQDIHKARPHKGQIKVARKIRALISNSYQKSELGESWSVSRVQDPYTLRCIPQVHGVSHDIVEFASDILSSSYKHNLFLNQKRLMFIKGA